MAYDWVEVMVTEEDEALHEGEVIEEDAKHHKEIATAVNSTECTTTVASSGTRRPNAHRTPKIQRSTLPTQRTTHEGQVGFQNEYEFYEEEGDEVAQLQGPNSQSYL